MTNQEQPLILVAEDDEFNYFNHETILKKACINVIRAKNGLEAIELWPQPS
jgi:CheY-like chemotaxis protein